MTYDFYDEATGDAFRIIKKGDIGNYEQQLRERIAKEIESISLGGSSQVNGLGMRILAAEVARGKK